MPWIDDLIDQLHKAVMFSKIDLQPRYHQILIKAEDAQKTTFESRYGHYKYVVTSFGVTNAPTMFMDYMNRIFRPFLDKYVVQISLSQSSQTTYLSEHNTWHSEGEVVVRQAVKILVLDEGSAVLGVGDIGIGNSYGSN